MIPKIIHYCWFGRGEMPKLARKCIKSWKKYCPDYELRLWNEDSFDVRTNAYVQEAYEARKFAFVTDYVRLYALYHFGGIYMDTDVEVRKPLDRFLSEKGFSGFESDQHVPTGLMAAEAGLPVISKLLSEYDGRHFLRPDGTYDDTTNVTQITQYMEANGLVRNGEKQTVLDFTFYPKDYFCPKSCETGEIHKTSNTYSIHHFNFSWGTPEQKQRLVLVRKKKRKERRKTLLQRTVRKCLGDRFVNAVKKRIKG